MGLLFIDTLTIYPLGSGGTYDDAAGGWTPADPAGEAVYQGPCDFHDRPVVLARDAQGVPSETADGTAVLPRQSRALPLIQPDMIAVVGLGRSGVTREGRVRSTDFLANTVLVGWV